MASNRSKKSKPRLCGCKTHSHVCLNCVRPTCPLVLERNNGCYCDHCYDLAVRDSNKPMRAFTCPVPGCGNRTDQGTFRGIFCAPCYDYIVKGEGTHSQAYRNELVKANLRILASMSVRTLWSVTPRLTLATYGRLGR